MAGENGTTVMIYFYHKRKTRQLLARYNALPYEEKKQNRGSLERNVRLSISNNNVSVGTPFLCDYGCNIHIGDNVSVNMNCSFIDCNKITIGSHVLIASNVQIYTATHPIELSERLIPGWTPDQAAYFCRTYALPVTIEDGCWIGGGVIILPGVTIGKGCVIGAGSVVTKNIPADSLAVGNPCRVIREINKK